jgi:hypothetical protein
MGSLEYFETCWDTENKPKNPTLWVGYRRERREKSMFGIGLYELILLLIIVLIPIVIIVGLLKYRKKLSIDKKQSKSK